MGYFKVIVRVLLLILTINFFTLESSYAMGSGDRYVDAQSGLSYGLYKPVDTLNFRLKEFKLLPCGGGGEEWLYINFIKGKKSLSALESAEGTHCSNPGLSQNLGKVKVNNGVAELHVYCGYNQLASHRKCGLSDLSKNGGFLLLTLPGYYGFKGVNLQIEASGGVSYVELIKFAKGLSPASVRSSN
jgi:hypothetical protein